MTVSDRGLRTFVTTVRSGSLTAAARSLGLGQPAVSHAIARLEDAIGAPLLVRSRTGVSPTPVGEALLAELEPALARIDAAVETARGHRHDPTIALLASTSLATWWLLPRLPDFKRSHPDLPLRLVTTDTDAGVDMSSFDLWIPLGLVDRPSTETTVFCEEALVPVCSPALAEQLGLPRRVRQDPTALRTAPLLHLEERYTPRFDWPRWFAAHGIDDQGTLLGDRSTDYSLVLHAALGGQGVALGWVHLVHDLIADGRLVALGEPLVTDQPFVVLTDERQPLSPGARALRDWLVDSMREGSAATLAR